MTLIPNNLRSQLLANGRDPRADHVPLLKLFNPTGPECLLISEIQPYDEDVVYGLTDFGDGDLQVGPFSLPEVDEITRNCGFRFERDPLFHARHPLSVYREAARMQRGITTIPSLLDAAAGRLVARANGGL
jgi:hypothetical protein